MNTTARCSVSIGVPSSSSSPIRSCIRSATRISRISPDSQARRSGSQVPRARTGLSSRIWRRCPRRRLSPRHSPISPRHTHTPCAREARRQYVATDAGECRIAREQTVYACHLFSICANAFHISAFAARIRASVLRNFQVTVPDRSITNTAGWGTFLPLSGSRGRTALGCTMGDEWRVPAAWGPASHHRTAGGCRDKCDRSSGQGGRSHRQSLHAAGPARHRARQRPRHGLGARARASGATRRGGSSTSDPRPSRWRFRRG